MSIDSYPFFFFWLNLQSFFVGGGLYPTSILAGFDSFTMAAALNVCFKQRKLIISSEPYIYIYIRLIEMCNKTGDRGGIGRASKH